VLKYVGNDCRYVEKVMRIKKEGNKEPVEIDQVLSD